MRLNSIMGANLFLLYCLMAYDILGIGGGISHPNSARSKSGIDSRDERFQPCNQMRGHPKDA